MGGHAWNGNDMQCQRTVSRLLVLFRRLSMQQLRVHPAALRIDITTVIALRITIPLPFPLATTAWTPAGARSAALSSRPSARPPSPDRNLNPALFTRETARMTQVWYQDTANLVSARHRPACPEPKRLVTRTHAQARAQVRPCSAVTCILPARTDWPARTPPDAALAWTPPRETRLQKGLLPIHPLPLAHACHPTV